MQTLPIKIKPRNTMNILVQKTLVTFPCTSNFLLIFWCQSFTYSSETNVSFHILFFYEIEGHLRFLSKNLWVLFSFLIVHISFHTKTEKSPHLLFKLAAILSFKMTKWKWWVISIQLFFRTPSLTILGRMSNLNNL